MNEPREPAAVERIDRDEIEAWSAAARDLLEARRRQEAMPPTQPQISVVVDDARFSPETKAAASTPTPPEATAFSGLPPRLRDKLAAALETEERPKSRTLPLLVIATVVAALAVSSVLLQRFGVINVPLLRGLAGSPTVPIPNSSQDSLGASMNDVPSAAMPEASARPESTRAIAPAPAPTATAPAIRARVARPDSTRIYALAVGTFMDEERAITERDRMSANTGLSARIIPYKDSGVTMYRLVLGSWTSRSAAENRANQLVQASQVNEARVLLMGRGTAR